MSVEFSKKLAAIPGYVAGAPTGKPPESLEGEGIAQLASNESPFGPHPAVAEAITRAAAAANRYPDPGAALLRRRIAERYETQPGDIAVANGSCEILLAAGLALCEPGAEIVYGWPSFSMYPMLAPLSGAREIRVELGEGWMHDLDAIAAEITAATQLVLICNPNNPTSPHLPAARIAEFLDRVPDRVTVLLDEAYIEFGIETGLPLRARYPRLVVTRTMSKAYAIAGLRVGFGIARPELIDEIATYRPPGSVSIVSVEVATALLPDQALVDDRVEEVTAERARFAAGLTEAGWTVHPSATNFLLVSFANPEAADVAAEALLHRGLIPRTFPAGHPLDHCLRLTVRNREQDDRLIEAAREIRNAS